MSQRLTIIATIEAKAQNVDLVKAEVLKLIEPTRQEKGCLQYELHQDIEDSKLFIFVEKWGNKKLWQMHMESNHLQHFIQQTDELLSRLVVNQMHQIA